MSLGRYIMAENDEKKTTSKNTKKSEFKPGKKPAISTRKTKPKAKVNSEKKDKIKKEEKSDGISFSQIIVIIAVIVIIVLALIGGYNSLVSLQENVDNQYANLDTMLQRRARRTIPTASKCRSLASCAECTLSTRKLAKL